MLRQFFILHYFKLSFPNSLCVLKTINHILEHHPSQNLPSHFRRKMSVGNCMRRKRGRDYEVNKALRKNSPKLLHFLQVPLIPLCMLSFEKISICDCQASARGKSLKLRGQQEKKMDSYSYIKMFNYALEKQLNCKTNYKTPGTETS